MAEKIILPNNKKFKSCYDLVSKTTPDLSRALNEELLSAANGAGPADVRFQALPKLAAKIWTDFLSKDASGNSMAVQSSWQCCLGDLAEALLDKAIIEIAGSNESKEKKTARLEVIRGIVKDELFETPSNPGMVLKILMAARNLS